MISAVAWVKRGAANSVPTRYTSNKDLLKGYPGEIESSGSESDDLSEEGMDKNEPEIDVHDAETKEIMKKYNLDDYDDEDDDLVFSTAYKGSKEKDLIEEDDDEEDLDNIIIRDTDSILLAASTEDDQFSHVNVYIYEAEHTNLFIHHDIILPSFPLCIEWMEYAPKSSDEPDNPLLKAGTNTLAIGTFNPEIEIWDLNLIDALTPLNTLGGFEDHEQMENDMADYAKSSKKSRRKKKQQLMKRQQEKKLKKDSHTDAVMSLSWNSLIKNVLASGSADNTVKIWDLSNQQCLNTYSHHKQKVQALNWHPTEPNLLLSASYDKSAAIIDIRSPGDVFRWKLSADVERVEWNYFNPKEFFVSTEDGFVTCYDSLAPNGSLFTLQAHNGPVGGLSVSRLLPNCLATASEDKTLKVWDITDHKPTLVFSNDSMNTQLFALAWDRSNPNLLALGGKDHLQVVDMSKIDAFEKHFKQ